MIETSVLRAEHLTKTYRSGERTLTVLRDVSFTVPEGSRCAIVGPSGSGKTTLLGLCAGLDRPTSGSVALNGVALNDLNEDELAQIRNQHVGFVFQTFQLIPTLTALENVAVPLELRGESGVRRQATELLNQVGLGDRLDHYPAQLSGGEQQRCAVARALVTDPKVILADEPSGNLDEANADRLHDLLFDLARDLETELVIVTHNRSLADRCDRTVLLANGRLEPATITEATS